MYQLLFLIHGMGSGAIPQGDPEWWKDTVDNLRRYAKPFKHDAKFVLDSPKPGDILVVPLTYHTFFDEIRAQWSAQNGNNVGWLPLLQQLAFSDPAVMARVPGWVNSAGTFFWTHVLDVLLYRFVNEFRTPIRDEIALQIATAWHKADLETGMNTPVHFVAHSLGTAVLHDSIATLGTDPGFGAGTHLISSITTCANVSSVLETNFPTYTSIDRTVNCVPPPEGMTAAYFNYRHEIDPIAAVKKFDGAAHDWPASDHVLTIATEVKDWNVHGYSHYLDHPNTHIRLFERLFPNEPWATRKPAALAKYAALQGTPCPQAIASARTKLKAIISSPRPENAIELLQVIVDTLRVFIDTKTACTLEQGL